MWIKCGNQLINTRYVESVSWAGIFIAIKMANSENEITLEFSFQKDAARNYQKLREHIEKQYGICVLEGSSSDG